jgi:uncharacterized membrane protein YfcA
MDLTTLFALAAVVLTIGGIVKGIMGLGLPTITVGVLGLVMPPMQAAALAVIPTFVTNIWQTLAGPSLGAIVRRFWPMQLGILVGTYFGGELLARTNPAQAKGYLGMALIAYGLLGLKRIDFNVAPGRERWLGPPMGFFTGLANGATGLFVVPGALYMQALKLNKDDLVQAFGLTALVASFALGLVLWKHGIMGTDIAGSSAVALIPAAIGMMFGQKIRERISQELFRRCFFVAMLALGGYLVSRMTF